MSSTFDAVVIGAGIVGAACALELAEAGLSVAVIERDAIGSGATAAGMGHIVAMDDSEAQFALTSYSQSLWTNLAAELPPAVEYLGCGTIWVAADDEEMAEVRRKRDFYAARGIAAEVLDERSLSQAEPNLRPMAGGLLVPSDAVVYPPCAAGYLLEKALRLNTRLMLGASVNSAASGEVLLADGTAIHSPIIINATGALSPRLSPGIAVRKRKGHLIITDRYPDFLRHQLVELGYLKSAHSSMADSVAFNVQPRMTGQLLIGSSRQFDAEHSGIDRNIVTAMIDRAALYMPGLRSLSALRIWTGFRAATPDKLPLIGPTEDSTVYLATGHEGLGITTSLGTAKLLAGHLLHRPTAIPPGPFLPSRLASKTTHGSAMEITHA
jgi:glycine/D-amino acid oxidase-like deaminating enzyme